MAFNDFDMVLIGIGDEYNNNEDALAAYNSLAEGLEGKNYFVVSLCMDDIIYESNLNEERIVSPLGGKRKKQCPNGCDNLLLDPSEKECPICHKKLVDNNILAENYVEAGYLPMWEKHKKWLVGTLNKKILVLELGASMKFPEIIRFPFEKITFLNEKAKFIRVNNGIYQLSSDVAKKGKGIRADSVKWIIENINSL